MDEIKLIDIRENILSDNENQAEVIRANMTEKDVFMVNLMHPQARGKRV
ncbi:hypothetical protein [Dehalobacter sp. DCM]